MPKRSADSPLERAVVALDAALKSAGAPFMVIGGLAVIPAKRTPRSKRRG